MIKILDETTKNPITKIGMMAGVCWGGNIEDPEKNYKRGMDCILSEHGRTLEYPDVEMIIDGYSARCIREWYTHIGGAPTRLQSSTRYVKWSEDGMTEKTFVTPPSVKKAAGAGTPEAAALDAAKADFEKAFINLVQSAETAGVPREDIAMYYPLGMTTRIVDKRNMRNLVEMSHQRLCTRAYWEYRQLMNDICKALSEYSEEWNWVVDNLMMPKCEVVGFCKEKKSCGRRPKKD